MFAAASPGWFLDHAYLIPLIPGIAFAVIIAVGVLTWNYGIQYVKDHWLHR